MLNNCIKHIMQQELNHLLGKHFFSVILDETTEVNKVKFMAIMIQYWSDQGPKCLVHSLTECSEEQDSISLFQIVKNKIISQSYANNLVALATDRASVLLGKNNSVLQKLKTIYPKLWDVHCLSHCLSHCFNLISNYGAKAIPLNLEQVLKAI